MRLPIPLLRSTFAVVSFSAVAGPVSAMVHWEAPAVFRVNKLPARSALRPFPDASMARSGEKPEQLRGCPRNLFSNPDAR